ncbi:GerAB/ArcD/ProY family transporter [Rossellomorea sp. NS-SX7]|uniref:GerAB/ArcD/ProY family transporter n=1 Tax=Rossellomorea sp. NS-SX7 TaxID=3463856 RepID=UPI0040585D1E
MDRSTIEKISSKQFRLLVLFFSIGSSILLVPPALIQASKHDGWISGLVGMAIGAGIMLLYMSMMKVCPDDTLFSIFEKSYGKIIGKTVSLFYSFFIFFLTCEVVSNMGDFMTTQIMIETPKMYIHLLFLVPILYGVSKGLEVIGRSAQVIYPTFLILLVFLILFLIPEGEFRNIEPVLGEGVKPVLSGSFSILTVPYLELFILMMIAPHVNERKEVGRAFFIGGLLGGFILVFITFLTLIVMGYSFSSLVQFPTYVLAKKINIADFLQRVEVVAAAVWIISLFFKVAICFYATVIGLSEVFALKNKKILLYPVGVSVLYFSVYIYPNTAFFSMFVTEVILSYSLLFGLVIPLCTLIIIKLKNKKDAIASKGVEGNAN